MADVDIDETAEWLDALASLTKYDGKERAAHILRALLEEAKKLGVPAPEGLTTDYINTIAPSEQPAYPGDLTKEQRLDALMRWNAMMMVLRGGRRAKELGGHIATYASASTLYEVGFNHFFRGQTADQAGDLVYIQGHASPGIYARAFLEGRISEEQLDNFRSEVEGKGLSSYPHPYLMPDFWQFATVSMGLGPIQAIFQARFMKYLQNRGLSQETDRKVWAFLGDGEMDEPESLGALTVAAREGCDNLIFVVNCNLQRLDGPVRGNGKIIQELESLFHGAGWNVIKVVWGSDWDPLLEQDTSGKLVQLMNETIDGEYQNCKARNGAYVREHFLGKYPELLELVKDKSDEELGHFKRGGHDAQKVYAAYAKAVKSNGKPTVILAKSVKGFGMGESGEAQNITHQQKKMAAEDLKKFAARFGLTVTEKQIEDLAYIRPDDNDDAMQYLKTQRKRLGGFVPSRRVEAASTPDMPPQSAFDALLKSSGDREISTTMGFVRLLSALLKDKGFGPNVVPIVPDESRTFGMEGLFRQVGIYSPVGQKYKPMDADQLMYYREEKDGQILQEGLNEGGAVCSWLSAATAYSNHNLSMVPFYIYYSMFGFQRAGDLTWAAGDMGARGFLVGGTAGRTTLAGEGLQHQDGHSHILAGTIPNCRCYDPTFNFELAVIVQHGLKQMLVDKENVFYYLTVMNENYRHPDMPQGAEEGIVKGMYLLKENNKSKGKPRVQLLGSGAILREVIAAANTLQEKHGVAADIWSVTSFNELRRDALEVERWNRLHPDETPRKAYVTECLEQRQGPVIAATDYMKSYSDQVRAYVPDVYVTLGTDGFGRSDTRAQLRHFFEVDWRWITITALHTLASDGSIPMSVVTDAMKTYDIDPNKPNPLTV